MTRKTPISEVDTPAFGLPCKVEAHRCVLLASWPSIPGVCAWGSAERFLYILCTFFISLFYFILLHFILFYFIYLFFPSGAICHPLLLVYGCTHSYRSACFTIHYSHVDMTKIHCLCSAETATLPGSAELDPKTRKWHFLVDSGAFLCHSPFFVHINFQWRDWHVTYTRAK